MAERSAEDEVLMSFIRFRLRPRDPETRIADLRTDAMVDAMVKHMMR